MGGNVQAPHERAFLVEQNTSQAQSLLYMFLAIQHYVENTVHAKHRKMWHGISIHPTTILWLLISNKAQSIVVNG